MYRLLLISFVLLVLSSSPVLSQSDNTKTLWTRLGNETDGKERLQLLLKLGKELRSSSPDTALQLANEALSIAERIQSRKDISKAYQLLGKIHYYQGHYAQAIEYHELSLQIETEFADTIWQATLLNELGRAYHRMGNNPRASEMYLQSLKLGEMVRDTEMISVATNNLAIIFSDIRNDSAALHYYYVALSLAEALNDSSGIAISLNNLGSFLNELNRDKEAEAYYDRAVRIATKINDQEALSFIYDEYGMWHEEREEYDKAIDYFEKALAIEKKNGVRIYIAEALQSLTNVHIKAKNYDRALAMGLQVLDMSREIESFELRSKAAFSLATVYEKLRQFDKSVTFLKLGQSLRDSLLSVEKAKAITNLEALYQLEKKDAQVQNLNLEKELQTAVIKRQVIFRNTLIIFISLLLVLCILLIVVFRQKKSAMGLLIELNQLLFRQNQEIETKHTELNNLNKVKDKLFSTIAHDFKSPLTSIQGLLNLLKDDALTKDEVTQISKELASQVNYTTAFLENLLNWSRSQIALVNVKPENSAIGNMVIECFQLYRLNAQSKRINLINETPDSCIANVDPEMMKLVLRNLISNAIKFTQSGGEVRVASAMQDHTIVVSVSDTGVGITPEIQERLFSLEAYTTPGTHYEKGTGLGLILCKDFVEKNGGKIWVDSKTGQGTTINFTIPAGA